MTLPRSYKLLDHVSFTQVDDEAVLLNLESGSYFGLNHVGTVLINAFQEGRSLDNAVQLISEQYQTDASLVLSDINALIEQLSQNNLIELRD